METKDLIKSRIKITDTIKNDFSQYLNHYLKHKTTKSKAPFHEPVVDISIADQPNKFKKSLVDWRNFYSQTKFTKSSPKPQSSFREKQNLFRPLNSSFSFAKTTLSSRRQKHHTSSVSCRKIHSSFSASHSQRKKQPFDPLITPFVLIQNIYESSLNNLEEAKRAQTARIRHYYEKKAEKVEDFQMYDKLQTKIKTFCEGEIPMKTTEFVRSGRGMSSRNDGSIYQRKNKRIIMPNEYFKDLNKVKITRKNVLKPYPVQVQN